VWLNGQANDPVFKWCLNDLKINLSDKSYSRDWLHEAARMMAPMKLVAGSHPEGARVLSVMEKYGWDGVSFHGVRNRQEFEEDFRLAFQAMGF